MTNSCDNVKDIYEGTDDEINILWKLYHTCPLQLIIFTRCLREFHSILSAEIILKMKYT